MMYTDIERKWRLWFLLIAFIGFVLVVLAVVLPLTLIKPAGPAEVLSNFIKAIEREDFATAHEMLTAKDASQITSTDIRTIWEGESPADMQLQKEEVTGSEAQLTVYNPTRSLTMYIPCYLENGKWKISFSESTDDSSDYDNSDIY